MREQKDALCDRCRDTTHIQLRRFRQHRLLLCDGILLYLCAQPNLGERHVFRFFKPHVRDGQVHQADESDENIRARLPVDVQVDQLKMARFLKRLCRIDIGARDLKTAYIPRHARNLFRKPGPKPPEPRPTDPCLPPPLLED